MLPALTPTGPAGQGCAGDTGLQWRTRRAPEPASRCGVAADRVSQHLELAEHLSEQLVPDASNGHFEQEFCGPRRCRSHELVRPLRRYRPADGGTPLGDWPRWAHGPLPGPSRQHLLGPCPRRTKSCPRPPEAGSRHIQDIQDIHGFRACRGRRGASLPNVRRRRDPARPSRLETCRGRLRNRFCKHFVEHEIAHHASQGPACRTYAIRRRGRRRSRRFQYLLRKFVAVRFLIS